MSTSALTMNARMKNAMTIRPARAGLLACAIVLAGCSTPSQVNGSLNSVRQPVVERSTHALDLALAGGDLPITEQARLEGWFAALGLGYGDRVTIQGSDPRSRADIATIAARHGVLLGDETIAQAHDLAPDYTRVIVQRSRAYVPGCPDWSAKSTAILDNATSPGFGCAVNGNLAAMIADPEHLLKGAEGSGATLVMSGSKAIATYRALEPTGAAGLADISSRGPDE